MILLHHMFFVLRAPPNFIELKQLEQRKYKSEFFYAIPEFIDLNITSTICHLTHGTGNFSLEPYFVLQVFDALR